MRFKDYYEVMGVQRGATQDEIKRAYRKLARKFHPDVSKEKNAEERFKELQEAYEVLKDPERRAAYDQLGANWRQGQEFRPPPDWGKGFEFSAGGGRSGAGRGPHERADFSDFFSELFGARSPFGAGMRGFEETGGRSSRGFAAAGQDHVARVELDLDDAYRGGARTIDLRTPELTPDGHVTAKPRTLRVSIPAGVVEGQQIRLAGQGSPGIGGGPAGDLYLEVNFRPHAVFKLDGRDVTVQLPVAPWEAALGETVSVPTLGGPVEMKLPAGARAGQRLRLRGRGLPGPTPGDQYVVLRIVLPPDSPRSREFFERMKRELPFDPRSEWQREAGERNTQASSTS
ncbi:MAG TPA: DnaJ C-terminal domain-containing protein [Steroidobacteraceae bacterium]|nr:DnaJ C-terminal domain-containing protein [Steroidobacteraceae bacterium]